MQNRVHEVTVEQVVLAVLSCNHTSFNVCGLNGQMSFG